MRIRLLSCLGRGLERSDVASLWSLGTLGALELDVLVLFEAAEAAAVDLGVVHEDVRAFRARDEAEALLGVEPLHSSLCHLISPCKIPVRSVRIRWPIDQTACSARRKRRPHQRSARACMKHEHIKLRRPRYYNNLPTHLSPGANRQNQNQLPGRR